MSCGRAGAWESSRRSRSCHACRDRRISQAHKVRFALESLICLPPSMPIICAPACKPWPARSRCRRKAGPISGSTAWTLWVVPCVPGWGGSRSMVMSWSASSGGPSGPRRRSFCFTASTITPGLHRHVIEWALDQGFAVIAQDPGGTWPVQW